MDRPYCQVAGLRPLRRRGRPSPREPLSRCNWVHLTGARLFLMKPGIERFRGGPSRQEGTRTISPRSEIRMRPKALQRGSGS